MLTTKYNYSYIVVMCLRFFIACCIMYSIIYVYQVYHVHATKYYMFAYTYVD